MRAKTRLADKIVNILSYLGKTLGLEHVCDHQKVALSNSQPNTTCRTAYLGKSPVRLGGCRKFGGALCQTAAHDPTGPSPVTEDLDRIAP
jgi:hypothetical protein